jgi:hypothetical protein
MLLRVDDWQRAVHTFVLTGKADPIVIADDVGRLFDAIRAPKRLAVVDGAGHVHFGDHAETVHERMRLGFLSGSFPDPEIDAIALGAAMRPFSELLSETCANDTMRGLCLAHMDARLKDDPGALMFLESNLDQVFSSRGVDLDVVDKARKTAMA